FAAITGEDGAFVLGERVPASLSRQKDATRPFVEGENVRDFGMPQTQWVTYPYSIAGEESGAADGKELLKYFWPNKVPLSRNLAFGKTKAEMGKRWFDFILPTPGRLGASRLITFAFVATHNHFV